MKKKMRKKLQLRQESVSEILQEALHPRSVGLDQSQMCVKHFVAELSTLAMIWQHILAFGILSAGLRRPRLVDINKFKTTFSELRCEDS